MSLFLPYATFNCPYLKISLCDCSPFCWSASHIPLDAFISQLSKQFLCVLNFLLKIISYNNFEGNTACTVCTKTFQRNNNLPTHLIVKMAAAFTAPGGTYLKRVTGICGRKDSPLFHAPSVAPQDQLFSFSVPLRPSF